MRMRAALFGLTAIALPLPSAGQPCPAAATTCITVDWALDPSPTSSNQTCSYCATGDDPCTSGLFFPPADGRCTIRRALREASARPAGDRPILIRFTGLGTGGGSCTDGSQDSCDDNQYDAVNDQWRLFVDGNSDRFKLGDVGAGITLGQVAIVGPPLLPNGMPKIFLDGTDLGTGDNNPFTMAIHMTNNLIDRLGFLRGGDFIVVQDGMHHQTITNSTFGLHPDGDQIEHIDPDDQDPFVGASSLAGNSGVFIKQNTDDVTIEDNFFAGMEVAAVQVEDLTTDIVIQDNHVGTRIDGSVPVVPGGLQCNFYSLPPPDPNPLDPNSWYGGDGLTVNGTGALVSGNVIAGLHTHRSGGVKEPVAIEAFGDSHTVQNNLIGIGDDLYAAGICGEGIQFGGAMEDGHQILDNEIHRARMTINFDGPINWIDTTQTNVTDGGTTVRRNLVTDAPAPPSPATEKVYEMGPNIQTPIKGFEPAEITSIVGTQVMGRACPLSPCDDCVIDFYKDDTDGRNEALEHLGTVTADANGDFSFTLAAPLDPGFGIRTMTTSVVSGQIGNTAAGTTSEESSDDAFDQCAGLYLPGCPLQIDLTGTISGTQEYDAQNQITTTNVTFDSTSVATLTAGQSIALGNGTVFESGSQVSLVIDAGACP